MPATVLARVRLGPGSVKLGARSGTRLYVVHNSPKLGSLCSRHRINPGIEFVHIWYFMDLPYAVDQGIIRLTHIAENVWTYTR